MDLTIRRAHVDEAAVVAVLVARLLVELGDEGVDERALFEVARKLLAAGEVTALLAFADDRPVGVVTLNSCAAIYAGGRFGEICELYVGPEHRAAGVGSKLVEAAGAQARESGWTRLEVGAPAADHWPRSLDFYLANGFAEVGPRLKREIGT